MSRKVKVVLFLFVLAIAIICSTVEMSKAAEQSYTAQRLSSAKSEQRKPAVFAQMPLVRPQTSGNGDFPSLEETMVDLHLETSGTDPHKDPAKHTGVLPEGFVIITSGRYHVFAQVLFEADRLCSEYAVKEWKVAIMVKRLVGSADLDFVLTSETYFCDNSSVSVKQSVFADGHFQLMTSDLVYVTVSAIAPVSNNTKVNYLGLFSRW